MYVNTQISTHTCKRNYLYNETINIKFSMFYTTGYLIYHNFKLPKSKDKIGGVCKEPTHILITNGQDKIH